LVYMPLYNVPVQPVAQLHAALQVYNAAFLPVLKVGFIQCFPYSGNGIGIVFNVYYSKANAVVRYALVYFKLGGKGSRNNYVQVVVILPQFLNGAKCFNNSCEHEFYCLNL